LHDGIGDPKGNKDYGEILVGPMILDLQERGQGTQRLAVDEIDNSGSEEQTSDPPTKPTNRPDMIVPIHLIMSKNSKV
jgi:hypothetical protein